MTQQPLVYKFDDSMRMYATGANTQNRFMYWGYAYKMTDNPMYVRRAVKELESLDKFPDFNPLHIIDSGMGTVRWMTEIWWLLRMTAYTNTTWLLLKHLWQDLRYCTVM